MFFGIKFDDRLHRFPALPSFYRGAIMEFYIKYIKLQKRQKKTKAMPYHFLTEGIVIFHFSRPSNPCRQITYAYSPTETYLLFEATM